MRPHPAAHPQYSSSLLIGSTRPGARVLWQCRSVLYTAIINLCCRNYVFNVFIFIRRTTQEQLKLKLCKNLRTTSLGQNLLVLILKKACTSLSMSSLSLVHTSEISTSTSTGKRQAYARAESVIHEPNHFCACVCLAFVPVFVLISLV